MSAIKTIGVLGCGWLGAPLAQSLSEEGYDVKGTVTSEVKRNLLKKDIKSLFILRSEEEGVEGDLDFFLDLDVLVIAIPPQLRKKGASSFVKKIDNILCVALERKVRHIIYVGTTAVFPNDNKVYNEQSELVPFDNKTEQLIEVEKKVMGSSIATTIIRFGGLINESRHPVVMLSKREQVKNPLAPVNIIHQVDAVGMIVRIVKQNSWNTIYHGIAPYESTKEIYYSKEAEKRGLSLNFDHSAESLGKKVLSKRTNEALMYQFQSLDLE